ncbi:hypothetical protein [Sandarakinorhabdus sp.]|uniref:hypothetical protein n=1 Tax=Sandarakinorhabdus sp. TaxID=1916663 RepID=UPI003568C581
MSSRIIALPLAIVAAATFIAAAASPAAAAQVSCTATPAQIRTLAVAKGGETAVKALHLVVTGEKLCAADARYEAGKKFAAAAKLLGTELAALPAAAAQ